MASLEGRPAKHGTNWRVIYYWQGEKRQIKIGVTNKRTAQQRCSQIETFLASGIDPSNQIVKNPGGTSLSKLRDKDFDWCRHRRQPGTVELNNFALNALINFLGDIGVNKIRAEDIEKFMVHLREDLGWKKSSCNIYLRHLKAIFQRAIEEHHVLNDHPFRGVKPHSIAEPNRTTFLRTDQINLLLESIDDLAFKRLIQFYLWTGCRRGEALELYWSDVDIEGKVVYLGHAESLTKKRRGVPITGQLLAMMKEMQKSALNNGDSADRVFYMYSDPRAISRRFSRLRSRVEGLPVDLFPHTLRHTFASHLVMSGVDMKTLAELMGHTTVHVTELYAHLLPEHKVKAIGKLPY